MHIRAAGLTIKGTEGAGMDQTVPLSLQKRFWNEWNASHRQDGGQEISRRQAEVICAWLDSIGRTDLDILEVGCGTGWMSRHLVPYGRLTATDLSDDVLLKAQQRFPAVTFIAGDFMAMDVRQELFDVVVSLEVLSHIANQPAFIAKLARHLKPGGLLMLATQNRYVLQRFNRLPPPAQGQLRHWVDRRELEQLLAPEFEILELFSVTPQANKGVMKLLNSERLNRVIRVFLGRGFDRLKERLGLGWTLMALGRKRA